MIVFDLTLKKNVSNIINNSNAILKYVKISNKPNKILLKWLNSRILKDEGLN